MERVWGDGEGDGDKEGRAMGVGKGVVGDGGRVGGIRIGGREQEGRVYTLCLHVMFSEILYCYCAS